MSNLLRTIQQVTRDYVDSISHRLPSIKNGTVTATSSDGTATVRVDGDTATTGSVPSIATVKTGDRVKMVLFNRQLTILGAIQRTDKLVADTIAGGIGGRNLVLDSKPAITTDAYRVLLGLLSEPWVDGATYTVTIKGAVNTPNTLRLYRDNGYMHAAALTKYDAERGVYTATFVCPPRYQDRDPYEFSIYNYPSATATSASIEWIKIERGSVATDWTRAPEDSNPGNLREIYFYTPDATLNLGGVVEAVYATLPVGLSAVDVSRAGSRRSVIVNKTNHLYGTAITTSYDTYDSMFFSRLANGTWQHSRVNMTALYT